MDRASQKSLILVLGMHRSGTSAVTRVLNLLGADLGGDLLSAQAGVNERGFWELRGLVELNERLLVVLDRRWFDYDPLPDSWWLRPEVQALESDARALLAATFGESALAAIKDPRLCLLLPFWLRVIEQLGWRPVVVLVMRDPDEVANSLCRRDPFTSAAARLLWLRYSAEAERQSRGLGRCVLSYSELLQDWRGPMERLRRDSGIDWPRDPGQAAGEIARELDPGLRHHVGGDTSVTPPDMADSAYRLFSGGGAGLDEPALDRLWSELDAEFAAAPQLVAACREASGAAIDAQARQSALGAELETARATVEERDGQLEACHGGLDRLGAEHAEALAVLQERDRQLDECHSGLDRLGGEHAEALAVLRERDRQLQEVQQQLYLSGQELSYAQSVVAERDAQLDRLGGELSYAQSVVAERDAQLGRLGGELSHAQLIVAQRDAELAEVNRRLQELGQQHGYAIGVVRERDGQLEQANRRFDELAAEFRRVQEILSHPAIRLLRRGLKLG